MMADDLVFPPDDISSLIGDFDSNLSEDILRTDINPTFPQSELLNIPQILPPMIGTSDPRRTFQNIATNRVGSTYTPISQLMKQTEELTSTLGSPLSSSLNQQVNFNNIVDTTSPNNQTLTNNASQTGSLNFVNSHAPKNTQYLVVGGQRIIQQNLSPHSQQRQHTPLQSPSVPSLSITSPTLTNNSLSKNNKSPLQQSFQPPTTNASNQSKQSLVLKMPAQQQILQTGLPGQKEPLKGSLIKTANQQIMFVTEVNGKKVGYIIQHPKPNNAVSSTSQPTTNVSLSASPVSSMTVPSAPISLSMVSPVTNNTPTNPPNNLVKSLNQNGTSEKLIVNKDQETKTVEMTKLLRERLQGLRGNTTINFKNQLNLKQQALGLSKSDKNVVIHNESNNDIRVSPVSQNINSVSKILSDFESVLNKPDTNVKTSLPQQTQSNKQTESMEFIDDEDGQEIEFSENDLTADKNEDSDEPMITSISTKQCNEIDDITENNIEDDDSDSMPLALLRTDTFEEPISIIRENEPTKKVRKLNKETSDSLPLSVVAASLKKDQEDGKAKKRGRKKKKKKDEDEPIKPILAYQVFFKEAQQKLKEENPMYKENFGELSKKIGQLWEVLDPEKKKVYQDDYNKAKAEYQIKLAEYKDKKAKEMEVSPVSIDELHNCDDGDDENVPLKKSSTKKLKKKSPTRKKVTSQTIASTTTLSPPLNNLHEETIDTFSANNMLEDSKPLKRKYNKSKKIQLDSSSPPSPSPPSTDTEDDETTDDDDEDSEISRIRELAAKATKQLKKIEKQSGKGKNKETNKKIDRVVKMEVQTISENTIIEHPKEVLIHPEPKIEKNEILPLSPSSSVNLIKKTEGKMTSTSNITVDDERNKMSNVILSSPPPKSTFKIPKRNNGDKIQAQGPRLCVRESCSNPVKATRERGAQYCSNECLVLYCREVFDSWVIDRQNDET